MGPETGGYVARNKRESREGRHRRIRRKVSGSGSRPRLSVYRSLNHIYAQVIDDTKSDTIVAASSMDSPIREMKQHKGNVKTAREVGALLARKAMEKGVRKVIFDRSGYLYHGRIKALADAAREAGLEF
jgi:large subunit ribosomal protein L18